jgi:glycosyltransferase involved in cell wall biosynthesis
MMIANMSESQRTGLVLTGRQAGTDGVSLEMAKLAEALEPEGINFVYCAGELDAAFATPGSVEIPEMRFTDPAALELGGRAFDGTDPDRQLLEDISAQARPIASQIMTVIKNVAPDFLVVQNAMAIPMQLPMAKAIANTVEQSGLPCVSHEHDYWWERDRFLQNRIGNFLNTYFPFDAPNVGHLAINSLAARQLYERRGVEATLLPNVFDYDTPPPGIDEYNQDFREAIGLTAENRIFLQPTRVIRRKGIEMAIDLVRELNRREADPTRNVIVISHEAGDEGMEYLEEMQQYARDNGVRLLYVADRVGDSRGRTADGQKVYSLWDAYPHADFVTYPSTYEGCGNAFYEAVYFKKPILVNRYPVYVADIEPKGFDVVAIDGRVTVAAVNGVEALLANPLAREVMTEGNYRIAREHYSYHVPRRIVPEMLAKLGMATGGAAQLVA